MQLPFSFEAEQNQSKPAQSLAARFLPKVAVFLLTPDDAKRFLSGDAFAALTRQFAPTYVFNAHDRTELEPLMSSIEGDADIRFLQLDPNSFAVGQKATRESVSVEKSAFRDGIYRKAKKYRKRISSSFLKFASHRRVASLSNRLVRLIRRHITLPSLKRRDRPAPTPRSGQIHLQHPKIATILAEVSPLLVLVPFSRYSAVHEDLVLACNANGTTCLEIHGSWSSRASRKAYRHRADVMGCWSEYDARQVKASSELAADHVFTLGIPESNALFVDEQQRAGLRSRSGVAVSETLVLLESTALQSDEDVLIQLDGEITRSELPAKILFESQTDGSRPGSVSGTEVWRNIVFHSEDPTSGIDAEDHKPFAGSDHRSAGLSAADAVIACTPQLVIEAIQMSRPVLAVAFRRDLPHKGASVDPEMSDFFRLQPRYEQAAIRCNSPSELSSCLQRLVREARRGSDRRGEAAVALPCKAQTYAGRLAALTQAKPAAAALRAREAAGRRAASISHHYAADQIIGAYVGKPEGNFTIPGFWMHGWLPPHFNADARTVAMHKVAQESPAERRRKLDWEKHNVTQWVARPDQVAALKADGYARVEAIGLPFAYLPHVEVERRPDTLLVMPPHSQKQFFDGEFARRYAEAVASLRPEFDEIVVCVTQRDYYRGEWRPQFQEVGIPVIFGASPDDPSALLRQKEMLSAFEYVTTNAMGSQIAYAAHCGAKVSIWGPFSEWPAARTNSASRTHPELARHLAEFQSESVLRREFPFLFRHPRDATELQDWGSFQIGFGNRRSPEDVAAMFGPADDIR